MPPHGLYALRIQFPEPDINPDLLQAVQAYLEARSQGREPALALSAAWEHFYQNYNSTIYKFAVSAGAPANEVADCVQDVWTALLAALANFRYDPQRSRFASWLYALVKRKATDIKRRRILPSPTMRSEDPGRTKWTSDENPAAECERHEEVYLVRRTLDELAGQLSPRDYRIFQMRWVDELPPREIASALKATPGQVWSSLHRTKQEFRRLLSCHWPAAKSHH